MRRALSAGNRGAPACASLWRHVTRRPARLAKHLLFIFNSIIKGPEKYFPGLYLFYLMDFTAVPRLSPVSRLFQGKGGPSRLICDLFLGP